MAITNYELMYIIGSDISDEEKAGVISFVENTLKSNGADNLTNDKMGERKLAYEINKRNTGFYVLAKFGIEGTKLKEVERKINLNEKIIRYILVKKD